MKDLIITICADTRKVKFNRGFIGLNGENLQGNIIVDFTDKADFVDGVATFEVEQNGNKYKISMTKDSTNKMYKLPIYSSLLAYAGEMKCQVAITQSQTSNGIPVFKSEIFKLPCYEAINANGTIPEQYPAWIDTANAKILEMDALIEDIKEVAIGKNILINPDFSINQRGQTSYNSGGYTFDRWQLYSTGNVVENLSNGYGVKLSAPSTIASSILLQQKIEININHLLGKTLTISAKISDYISTNNNYQIIFRCHNTTTYGGNIANATIDVTSKGILSASVTVPYDTLSVSVAIRSNGQESGDYVDVDWIKLEVGSVATEFVSPLIVEELQKCKRYYQRFTTKSDYREYGIGFIASTTTAHIMIPLGGEMRLDNPTLSISDKTHFTVRYGSSIGTVIQTTISGMEIRSYSKSGFFITATLGNTLSIEYGVASLRSANTDGYISLNAEIY